MWFVFGKKALCLAFLGLDFIPNKHFVNMSFWFGLKLQRWSLVFLLSTGLGKLLLYKHNTITHGIDISYTND